MKMPSLFFKKFIPIIVILSLVIGLFSDLLVKKAEALSPGEAVGKAVGAGVACFIALRAESFVKEVDPLTLAQAGIITLKHP
jgi:hypothetical protein